MSQIRVFVVDDSVVFRKLFLTTINGIPGVRTVGVAANGKEALEAIPVVKPDLITLDFNMPVMDGLKTLIKLRESYPQCQVIMVSSYTTENATATLNALEAGALDFITKPDSDDELVNSKLLREQFTNFLSRYTAAEINQTSVSNAASDNTCFISIKKPAKTEHSYYHFKPEIVAIGTSTGGPAALAELLPSLPASFPLPIVIVQHMPALFTKTLAESLNRKAALHVIEAQDKMVIKPGTVYIAPGGTQMKIINSPEGAIVQITDAPPENYCKPSADYLFRSVSQVYMDKAIGVILTGMGSDGVLGLQLMKRQGARVIAQDRETCTIWGMPRMAYESGVVDIVLPLHEIASELINATQCYQ